MSGQDMLEYCIVYSYSYSALSVKLDRGRPRGSTGNIHVELGGGILPFCKYVSSKVLSKYWLMEILAAYIVTDLWCSGSSGRSCPPPSWTSSGAGVRWRSCWRSWQPVRRRTWRRSSSQTSSSPRWTNCLKTNNSNYGWYVNSATATIHSPGSRPKIMSHFIQHNSALQA